MGSRRITKEEMPNGMREISMKKTIQGSPTMRMLRELEEDERRREAPAPKGTKK